MFGVHCSTLSAASPAPTVVASPSASLDLASYRICDVGSDCDGDDTKVASESPLTTGESGSSPPHLFMAVRLVPLINRLQFCPFGGPPTSPSAPCRFSQRPSGSVLDRFSGHKPSSNATTGENVEDPMSGVRIMIAAISAVRANPKSSEPRRSTRFQVCCDRETQLTAFPRKPARVPEWSQ